MKKYSLISRHSCMRMIIMHTWNGEKNFYKIMTALKLRIKELIIIKWVILTSYAQPYTFQKCCISLSLPKDTFDPMYTSCPIINKHDPRKMYFKYQIRKVFYLWHFETSNWARMWTELHLSHRVTLRAFLRLVAFCFLMAFVSIYPQIQGKNFWPSHPSFIQYV